MFLSGCPGSQACEDLDGPLGADFVGDLAHLCIVLILGKVPLVPNPTRTGITPDSALTRTYDTPHIFPTTTISLLIDSSRVDNILNSHT